MVGHRLRREPLAALVPAALQKRAPGAGSHARAKAVGARALALLGLVGALHALASQGTRSRRRRLWTSCRQPRLPAPRGFSRVLRDRSPGPRASRFGPLYTRHAEGNGGLLFPPGPFLCEHRSSWP